MMFSKARFSIVAGLSLSVVLGATPALALENEAEAAASDSAITQVAEDAEAGQGSTDADDSTTFSSANAYSESSTLYDGTSNQSDGPADEARDSTTSEEESGVENATDEASSDTSSIEGNEETTSDEMPSDSLDDASTDLDALEHNQTDTAGISVVASTNAIASAKVQAKKQNVQLSESSSEAMDSATDNGESSQEGERYVNGAWYYYNADGTYLKGWKWFADNDVWVYYDSETGKRASGEVYVTDGENGWCYFDEQTGATQYGWRYVSSNGGKWVYYDPITGRMWHGEGHVTKDNAKTADPIPGWCYFDDVTGATQYKWKWLSSNGGKWVYYDDVTGRMYHGEAYVYSGNDESAKKSGKHWYYFNDATGATTYGWKNMSDGRTVYYIPTWGWMAHGYYNVTDVDTYAVSTDTDYMKSVEESHDRSVTYYFDINTGNLTVGSSAAWNAYNRIKSVGSSTGYVICVDLTNYRTVIFQGSAFNWTPIFDWLCGIGKTSNANGGTYTGSYTLGSKSMLAYPRYFSAYGNHYWGVNMWEGFGFHSTLDGEGSDDQQLGREVSLACIRLHYGNAKWLYKHCADGTPVYIYR